MALLLKISPYTTKTPLLLSFPSPLPPRPRSLLSLHSQEEALVRRRRASVRWWGEELCASSSSSQLMAEQGRSLRITRAAKKRAATAAGAGEEPAPVTKKRVVLGELPNLSNIVVGAEGEGNANVKPKPRQPKAVRGKVKKPPAESTVSSAPLSGPPSESGDVDPTIDVEPASDDPQMCRAYVADIYEYLHKMEMEPHRRPLPDYLEKVQKDVTANMRGILVDWLIEVAEEYKLLSDTLYLSISYIDRFLSLNALNRQKLQLLGVSAMLIAS